MENFDKVTRMNDYDLFAILEDVYIPDYSNENVDKDYCTMCNSSTDVVEDVDKGLIVCTGCGTVIGDIFDCTPEWNNYDEGGSNTKRCNGSTNFFLPQSSLGTTIAGYGWSKVKVLHSWGAMPYKERSLNDVLKMIQRICRKANILKCIEDDAKILYYNVNESKHRKGKNVGQNVIIRGKNRSSLIAACIFYACKRKDKMRSPKEIAEMCGIDDTDVTRGCKKFISLIKNREIKCNFNSSTPEQFVPRICKALKIKGLYVDECVRIAKNISKLNLASAHTPLSVATGSIMIVADCYGVPVTKKDIATQFDVSEVTILKACKKLEPFKNIIKHDILTDKIIELLNQQRANTKLPVKLQIKYNRLNNIYDPDTDDLDSYAKHMNDKVNRRSFMIDEMYKELKL